MRLLVVDRAIESSQQAEELLAFERCSLRILQLIEKLLHIDVLRVDLQAQFVDYVTSFLGKLLVLFSQGLELPAEDWMLVDFLPRKPFAFVLLQASLQKINGIG